MIQSSIAGAQNFRVEVSKVLEVRGNVRRGSCGGGCCEGHDGTACAGVRVRNEWNKVVNTAVYDNVPCCVEQCTDRQHCGLPLVGHSGPADSCPGYTGRFSATVGELDMCVTPGETFWIPVFTARAGNLVNNSWSGGSKCKGSDEFEPYSASEPGTTTQWGGFWDSCPDPQDPNIVCVPSDCGTGITFYTPPGLRPSAEAEIIEPYGNELYPRWDYPGVALRWRPAGQVRTDTYRVVAFDWRNKILDEIVVCPHDVCSYSAMFPIEPASYYWWVQPLADDTTGKQSRAGYFNLARPLTSCGGLGGTCSANTGPYGPSGCQGGGVPIYGAVDCPQECCSGDCSRDDTHDHSGSCGSTDVCGHVFGSPNDPGCGPEPPPDTMSCGELGGDHCSQTLTCPQGQYSMGTTRLGGAIECVSCCREAIGDGYCEPDEEDCGTSPDDCACRPGDVCVTSGYPSECVDQCSDPALHDHTGSCGELDECGHPVGDPRECLDSCGTMGGDHCSQTTACPSGYSPLGPSSDCLTCCEAILCQSLGCPAGSCGWQTDNCGEQIFCGECGPSCGETGGDYCSQTGSCPAGYASLGSTYDCGPCCRSLDSCGEMGGNYCSQTGSCPAGYNSLGASFDCSPCCKAKPCQSTGCPAGSCGWRTDNCGSSIFCGQCAPTCGAMGGDYCSQTNGCPGGYASLGQSSDCKRCCKSPPSCGAMGGNYCSQTGSCPAGYTPLGQSNDCSPCCVSN